MAQYMFSAYGGEAGPAMTEEEMQRSWQKILALEEEMKSAGALVFSGKLLEPETATVVRVADGDVMTTDGPFAESKEHLGGSTSSRHVISTKRSAGRRRPPPRSALR